MHKSRAGLRKPPFQLSPDPTFYVDSRSRRDTHHRFNGALESGTCALVLSGEVGAGKTMMLREAFARIAATDTLIANVVNSQLDACELLQVALTGFGRSPSDISAASLRRAF